MQIAGANPLVHWKPWRLIVFRFFFLYLLLQIAPWTFIGYIPGGDYLMQFYYQFIDWLVNIANENLFHVREQLVPVNGSGDTSYAWTQLWLYLSLAFIGCAVWSLIDRKSTHYIKSDYWLRTIVRYFIAMQALSYGIIKFFAMQMFFPNLSQLATPLGDFLPMRLSWMFMGYSTQYQVFSGVMEVIAGLLLLNRSAITAGLLMAAGVFTNVVMLNLSYDIPVKLFSLHLLFYSVFLLTYESKRLLSFFVLNHPVTPSYSYQISFSTRRMRYGRYALKALVLILIIVMPFISSYQYYQSEQEKPDTKPITSGLYDVQRFIVNGDTLQFTPGDSLTWKDVVFDKGYVGSVNSTDTIFRQRYRRGYFNYKVDSAQNTLSFYKRSVTGDSTFMFTSEYFILSPTMLSLKALIRNDSVQVDLIKSKRHFQLTEKQFHWLSEYNR